MTGLLLVVAVALGVILRAQRASGFDPQLPDDWRPSRTVIRQQSQMDRIIRGV